MKHADSVYRNENDSIRIRLFQRYKGQWDFDVFERSGGVWNYTSEYGEGCFPLKRDAKCEAENIAGKLRPIQVETVTEGWDE